MKIFIVGGTGLLGSEAAKELIKRGHQVTSIALPPIPMGANLPAEMELTLGNYLTMSDEELRAKFTGAEGFIFAAGVDERVEGPAPIYDFYDKYNIKPLERMLKIAKESGVKHVVVLGSYFAYFERTRPDLHMAEEHPYIRSRVVQETMAMSYADDGKMNVAVLELPYIFGTQPGRKPVWVFLVEMVKKMKPATMWPKGGTTMVTVRQVGQAIAGALEKNVGGHAYPIGWYNMNWKQMLTLFHKYMGTPKKKIWTIPTAFFKMGMYSVVKDQKKRHIDGGLKMVEFTKVMTSELFIKPEQACIPLGVTPDDIEKAIAASVELSLDVLNKKTEVVAMKGE
ncbi:MAG: NAD(P)-dependent oxidoreductase [Firmicutes bacterium]|nr:NAD(P)-dependent oxidoreductase [Bacillota bacterium]